MSLQVVYLDKRNVIGDRESLGKRDTYKQRAEQAGTSSEGYGIDLVDGDTGLFESGIDNGYYVLLVGTRGELGDYASILLMYCL
jgi:hypothetical protein